MQVEVPSLVEGKKNVDLADCSYLGDLQGRECLVGEKMKMLIWSCVNLDCQRDLAF